MATITVDNQTFEVADGARLILALKDAGVDILHRCGGNARCTTCRVEFMAGEPEKMTVAEHDKLESQGNLGKFRLSCQSLVNADLHVKVLMPFAESGLDSPGDRPKDYITPEPEWVTR